MLGPPVDLHLHQVDLHLHQEMPPCYLHRSTAIYSRRCPPLSRVIRREDPPLHCGPLAKEVKGARSSYAGCMG
jgi:hypothetical protein